jgi:hypothetical protein
MRRAKIQVKPNIGNKASSGLASAVKNSDNIEATVASDFVSSLPVSVEQPVCQPVKEGSLDETATAESVCSSAPASAEVISANLIDQSTGCTSSSVANSLDVGPCSSISECAQDTGTSSHTAAIVSSAVSAGACIRDDKAIDPDASACANKVSGEDGGKPVLVSASISGSTAVSSNSSSLPAPKAPARRLKSSWKPNVAKVSADPSTVKPAVTLEASSPAMAPVPSLKADLITCSALPSSSSMETTCITECVVGKNTEEMHTSSATDTVDYAGNQRVIDGLASPTSILRRGKFMAKPNVAKAARVR